MVAQGLSSALVGREINFLKYSQWSMILSRDFSCSSVELLCLVWYMLCAILSHPKMSMQNHVIPQKCLMNNIPKSLKSES